jgi:hypothetical protein
MRLSAHLTRPAIFVSLVVAAVLCGGWKWEGVPF